MFPLTYFPRNYFVEPYFPLYGSEFGEAIGGRFEHGQVGTLGLTVGEVGFLDPDGQVGTIGMTNGQVG